MDCVLCRFLVLATEGPSTSQSVVRLLHWFLQPPKKVDKKAAPAKAGKEKAAKSGGKAKKKVCPGAVVWGRRLPGACFSTLRWPTHGGGFDFLPALQKWSKGKVKEKVANAVFFDKALYEKCVNEVPKFKLITASIISERMRVNGSLARRAIKDLMAKGLIRVVRPPTHSPPHTHALTDSPAHIQKTHAPPPPPHPKNGGLGRDGR